MNLIFDIGYFFYLKSDLISKVLKEGFNVFVECELNFNYILFILVKMFSGKEVFFVMMMLDSLWF